MSPTASDFNQSSRRRARLYLKLLPMEGVLVLAAAKQHCERLASWLTTRWRRLSRSTRKALRPKIASVNEVEAAGGLPASYWSTLRHQQASLARAIKFCDCCTRLRFIKGT